MTRAPGLLNMPARMDPHGLTRRERAVVNQLLTGRRPLQIAGDERVSYGAITTLAHKAYRKLGVHSQAELMAKMAGQPAHVTTESASDWRPPEHLHARLCRLQSAAAALLPPHGAAALAKLAGKPLAAELVVARIDRVISVLMELRRTVDGVYQDRMAHELDVRTAAR